MSGQRGLSQANFTGFPTNQAYQRNRDRFAIFVELQRTDVKPLPRTNNPLVVRTDFEHQDAWETICNLIRAPVTALGVTFHAQVQFLEDVELRGLATRDLLARLPRDYEHPTMFVVDSNATTPPDYPILVIDLGEEFGRTFRAIPSAIQGIENNLSIANMGFSEFAAATDKDGIFRGFPAP